MASTVSNVIELSWEAPVSWGGRKFDLGGKEREMEGKERAGREERGKDKKESRPGMKSK